MSESSAPTRSRADLGQLLLPFAEREYIDVKRAARILGVSHSTTLELHRDGEIEMIDYAKHKRKRVRYQSVVDFCDRLRKKHSIADRRPRLDAPFLRHRDDDLLPFSIEDTIGMEEVMEILGYSSRTPVYLMIEEGRFEAYQISNRNPWRISRSSLALYLDGVLGQSRIRQDR